MTSPASSGRRAGLLGVRRRLAESRSARDSSKSSALTQVLRKSRSLLEGSVHCAPASSRVARAVDRLQSGASDSRERLLHSFYQVVRSSLPDFEVEALGVLSTSAVRHLFANCANQLRAVFGAGNVLRFHARRTDGTEGSLIFRGELYGCTVDLIVSRAKFKGLSRYLERPSDDEGEVSQNMILLNPRILGQRLVVAPAVVIVVN
ncbi:Sensor histidine kinase glucose-6-phosphate specific, putative [Babesia caballi]|uniref:Sensor histidine kinase glucose-6-phosphate specific, putative n=1 Tax=Babesia caballi TaxID=5871 RepID=A0AAV4LXC7_BABCB|nr:Sensor histidine kinase glucose-6-phosphate specific, putative [Babesia caballi]